MGKQKHNVQKPNHKGGRKGINTLILIYKNIIPNVCIDFHVALLSS